MFEYYKEKYPDTDVTYTLYKYIISKFNKKVSKENFRRQRILLRL